MNIRYLGTRLNKRQARGFNTGNRYSYSAGQPVFTIDDADQAQFSGEIEDGRPKFQFEDRAFADSIDTANEMHAQGIKQLQQDCTHERLTDDHSSCVECGKEFVDGPTAMKLEAIADKSIAQMKATLPDLDKTELETLMHLEDIGAHRKGAYAVIQAAIDES